MSEGAAGLGAELPRILGIVREQLKAHGIDLDSGCCGPDSARIKVVCVAPDLKASVEELGKSPRDQVVMVRVDSETAKDLDAWVETGAVRSRSEAAAVFMREGLQVRSAELAKLRDALREVESARERLRARAREVLGDPDVEGGNS